MSPRILLAAALAALPFIQATAAGPPSTGASPVPGETQDAGFIKHAGEGGLAEVEISRIALAHAQSPDVRRFAQQMVDEHGTSNQELGLIAGRQQQKLPAQMDDDHRRLAGRLERLRGPEFDRAYMDAMIEDHEKMADMLGSAKGTSSDNQVRKFASNTLPVVEEHLRMAQAISARLR